MTDLRESAASGDRLAALRDLRDLLADKLMTCESLRDFATLSRQMTDVLAQIAEAAPPEVEGDGIDEIAARRAARRPGAAKGSTRSKRPS